MPNSVQTTRMVSPLLRLGRPAAVMRYLDRKMKMCLDWLGVHETRRTFADAQFRADDTYGIPLVEVGKAGSSNAIFRSEDEDVLGLAGSPRNEANICRCPIPCRRHVWYPPC